MGKAARPTNRSLPRRMDPRERKRNPVTRLRANRPIRSLIRTLQNPGSQTQKASNQSRADQSRVKVNQRMGIRPRTNRRVAILREAANPKLAKTRRARVRRVATRKETPQAEIPKVESPKVETTRVAVESL